MSKQQHFTSLLSPSQGKFPQPPPTSSDKSRHFKFSEPSPGKSVNKSSSKFVQPGYSSNLQELSAEISDVYDFRQKCFDKIKSLETVIERNRGTYENEINYMQEYIKLLKRKLAKGKGINESLEIQCEDCKDKDKSLNLLTGELENYEVSVRNTEGQNRILKNEVIRLRQELENMKKGMNLENQTQELLEIISELEETKQANDKLIFELRVENKKLEIQMRESGVGEVNKVRENFKEKMEVVVRKYEQEFSQFSEKINRIEVRVEKTGKEISSVQKKVVENVELRHKVQEYQEEIERVSKKESEVKIYKEVFTEITKSLKEYIRFDEPRGVKSEAGVKEFRVYKEYIDELVDKLKQSEKLNEELKEQNKSLEDIKKSQTHQLEDSKDLIQKLKKVEENLNELKEENSKIVEEKAENARSCLNALEKLQNMQEKFLQANERVKIFQEEKEQFTALGESLNKKLWRTEEELKEKQEEIERLGRKLGEMMELRGKYEEIEKKYVDKEQEVEKLQKIVEKYLNDKMNLEGKIKQEFEQVSLEEISRLDQDIVHLLEEKSVLLYLDMIQKLLEKLKSLFNSNEELNTLLERQKVEILDKNIEVQDMNQAKALLLQENSTLENTVNEKSVLIDKFQQLLESKNKELGKLQEIMQDLIDSSSKSAKNEFPMLSEESVPNKYSEIIRDLSENLKKVTDANEIIIKENKELQTQVNHLVSEISLRENTQNSQSISSKKSSESYESDKNSVKSNEEHFLSGYEEEKPFENSLPDDQTGEFNKCVSILSPLEPDFKQDEHISIVEFPYNPEDSEKRTEKVESELKDEGFGLKKIEIKPGDECLGQEIANLQQELRILKENNENLTKLKDDLEELVNRLVQQVKGLNLGSLEIELNKISLDEKDLTKGIQTIIQKIIKDYEESTEKMKDLSEENQELLRQLEQNEEKFLEVEKQTVEFENLKSLNKLLEVELKGLQSEMLKNESELIESYVLQEKIKQLEDLNDSLNNEKSELETQFEELSNELDSLKKNLRSISILNESLESELNYIKSEHVEVKSELNEFKVQLDEYEKVKSELLSENEKLDQRGLILEQENKSLQSSISKIISDLHEQNTIKDELLKALNENKTLENSEKELKNLNKNLSIELSSSNETVCVMQGKVKNLQERIEELLESLKDQDQIKEESQQVLLKNEELLREHENLNKDLKELKQCLLKNEETIRNLQEKCENFESLEIENKEMLEKLSVLQAREQILPEIQEELKSFKKKLNEANNENMILSEQLKNTCEELNDLKQVSEDQKLQIEKLEKIKDLFEQEQKVQSLSEQSLRDKLKKIQFENEGLLKDLEKTTEYKDIIHSLSKTKEEFELENQSLMKKLEESEGQLKNFEETEASNSRLLEQIRTLTDTCGKLEGLEKVLKNDLENLSKLHEALQSEHSLKSIELLQALKENQGLTESCQVAEENIRDLKEELVKLKLLNESMNKDLGDKKELESVVPGLVINNQVAERRIKELENKVKELLNEKNEFVDQIKGLEEKAEELENIEKGARKESFQFKERLQKTSDELKQVEKLLKDKSEENTALSHKLQELLVDNRELNENLPLLKSEKQELESELLNTREDLEKFKELLTNTEEKLRITGEKLQKTEENLNNLLDNFESLAIEKENLLTENDQISEKIIELASKLETQPDISGIIQSLANANKILDRENKDQASKLNQAEIEISDLQQEFKRLAQAYQGLESENSELKNLLKSSASSSLRKSAEFQKVPSKDPEDIKSGLFDSNEILKKENKELKRRLSNLLEKIRKEGENKEFVPELSEEISAIVKTLQEENSNLKEFIAQRPKETGMGKKLKKNEKLRSGVRGKKSESASDEDSEENKKKIDDEKVLASDKGKDNKFRQDIQKEEQRGGKERKRPELYLDEKEMSGEEESSEGSYQEYKYKDIKNPGHKEEMYSESDSREAGTPEFASFKEKIKKSPGKAQGSNRYPVDSQSRSKENSKPNNQLKSQNLKFEKEESRVPKEMYSKDMNLKNPEDQYSYDGRDKRDDLGKNDLEEPVELLFKPRLGKSLERPEKRGYKEMPGGKSVERSEGIYNQDRHNKFMDQYPAEDDYNEFKPQNPYYKTSNPSGEDPRLKQYYKDQYNNKYIPEEDLYKYQPKIIGNNEKMQYKHKPISLEKPYDKNHRDVPKNIENPESPYYNKHPQRYVETGAVLYNKPQILEFEDPEERLNNPKIKDLEKPSENFYREYPRNIENPEMYYRDHPKTIENPEMYYRDHPRNIENPELYYRDHPKSIENPENYYRDHPRTFDPRNIENPELYYRDHPRNFDDPYFRNQGKMAKRPLDPYFDDEQYRSLPRSEYYRGRPFNVGRLEGQYYAGYSKQPENQFFDIRPSAPEDPYYNYPAKSSSLQRPEARRTNQYYDLPDDQYSRGIPKSSSLERPLEKYYKGYPGPYPRQEDPYFNQDPRVRGQENPQFNPQYQYKEDLESRKSAKHPTRSSESHPTVLNPFPEPSQFQMDRPEKKFKPDDPSEYSERFPPGTQKSFENRPGSKNYSEAPDSYEINKKIPYVEYPPEYFNRPSGLNNENSDENEEFLQNEYKYPSVKNPQINLDPRQFKPDSYNDKFNPHGSYYEGPDYPSETKGKIVSQRSPDSKQGVSDYNSKITPNEELRDTKNKSFSPLSSKRRESSERPFLNEGPKVIVPGEYNLGPSDQKSEKNLYPIRKSPDEESAPKTLYGQGRFNNSEEKELPSNKDLYNKGPAFRNEEIFGDKVGQNKPKLGENKPKSDKELKNNELEQPKPEINDKSKKPISREDSWHEKTYKNTEQAFNDSPESIEITIDLSNIPDLQESSPNPADIKIKKNPEELKSSKNMPQPDKKDFKQEKYNEMPKVYSEEYEENRPKIFIGKEIKDTHNSGHLDKPSLIKHEDLIKNKEDPDLYQIKKSHVPENPNPLIPAEHSYTFEKSSENPLKQSSPKTSNPKNPTDFPHSQPPPNITYQYTTTNTSESLLLHNTQLTTSLSEALTRLEHQQKYIEDLLEKLEKSKNPEEKQAIATDISELLSKIKYQNELISELENKNSELESRFNRIRNKNNLLEQNTKKYSENVEKVFKDVNKKMTVIEKSIMNKEERIKAIFNDYSKFKQKYINDFQEKSKALLNSIFDPKNHGFEESLISTELDKDDLVKMLRGRIEFLQGKIEALVKSNFVTKEIIENIGDKVHDAIEMIKVD